MNKLKYINNYLFIKYLKYSFRYYWGLGIGDWGLGIGPNPQSPIPNPQSPIPNPHFKKFISIKINQFFIKKIITYKINYILSIIITINNILLISDLIHSGICWSYILSSLSHTHLHRLHSSSSHATTNYYNKSYYNNNCYYN